MRAHNVRYGGFHRVSGVVNGVGYIYDKDEMHELGCTDRTMQAYAMMYVLEGSGLYQDAIAGERSVSAGDVILVFPGIKHTYRRTDPSVVWSECWVEFQGAIFEALEQDGIILRTTPVLSPGLQAPLVHAFDEIIRDYQIAVPGDEAIFAARALLLLVRVAEAHKKRHESESDRAFVKEACARLQEALEENVEMAELARSFGLSERAFRRRFVKEMGVAPARYRLLQRIAVARTLLSESSMSVGAIAEKLGYCDLYFFSKQFKKLTGMTPAQFRRSPARVADDEA